MIPAILRPVRLVLHGRLPLIRPLRPIPRPLALLPKPAFTQIIKWNSGIATNSRVEEEIIEDDENLENDLEEEFEDALEEDEIDYDLEELKKTLPPEAIALLTRKFPLIQEFIGPSQSHLLTLSLQPYLKFDDAPTIDPEDTDAPHNPFTIKNILPIYGQTLPPGYHFAYFNGYTQESDLSPDGYIASQSPGGEWTRRMWAGGKLTFQPMPTKRDKGNDRGARRARPLDIGRRAICHEMIEDIQMKGEKGSDNEMMFVYIRRKLWAEGFIIREPTKSPKAVEVPEPDESELMVLPDEECPLIEQRCLVYMKDKGPKPKEQEKKLEKETETPVEREVPKMSIRAEKADFSHSLIPSSTLLFRYSALTFNAHKIHYDNDWTKSKEGHPKLIVHGPLTLTLLLENLRNHILGLDKQYKLTSFEYRNIAPLYVDEPLTLYGRWIKDAPVPPKDPEIDPRDQLPPLYDELDILLKDLKTVGAAARNRPMDAEEDPELRAEKKVMRRTLKVLRKKIATLEGFKPTEERDVEYRTYELWAENAEGKIAVRGTAMLEDLPPKVEMTPEQQWKRYQSQMARNKRMMIKQAKQAQFEVNRQKRRERKLKLREEQKERERARRLEQEQRYKEAREAAKSGRYRDDDDDNDDRPWGPSDDDDRR